MQPAPSQDLAVATPERVSLSLPVAGIGYRSIAYLTDWALLFAFWTVAYFVFSLFVQDVLALYQGTSGLIRTLALIGWFATQWMYWTICEVFWDGQTPGKRLLRIRVVREDGSPVGFFESAVRNLCRVIDFAPMFYAVGLLSMLVTKQNRRIGDLLAGTLLVREEKIDLDKYTDKPIDALPVSPALTGVAPLPSADVELILSFLSRTGELTPDARARLSGKMIDRFGEGLSPAERARIAASPDAAEAFLKSRASG